MVNICESLQRCDREQAKDADSTARGREGLPQKGKQPGAEALMSSPADEELPAYGRDLTYAGTYAEHDNPVRLPPSGGKALREER